MLCGIAGGEGIMSLIQVLTGVEKSDLVFEFQVDNENPFLTAHCKLILENCGVDPSGLYRGDLRRKAVELISGRLLEKVIKGETINGAENLVGLGCIEGTTGIKFISMNGTLDPKETMVNILSEKIMELENEN
jgi:hypothetical protein